MVPSADSVLTLFSHVRHTVTHSHSFHTSQVGINYDPMIAKIITWGPDRVSALTALRAALANTQVGLCVRVGSGSGAWLSDEVSGWFQGAACKSLLLLLAIYYLLLLVNSKVPWLGRSEAAAYESMPGLPDVT